MIPGALLNAWAGSARGVDWLAEDPRPLDWNGPVDRRFIPVGDDGLEVEIIERLERVARRCPQRVAVTDGQTSLTYAELWDGLSGLSEAIAARTAPGALVAIALPAGPMFPLAMLAAWAAGRPFVALDVHYPADWIGQVLADAQPALIVTDLSFETGAEPERVLRLSEPPAPAQPGWRPAALGLDAPACVLFTSGSTGRPKGIVNTQRNLLQRIVQSTNAAHVGETDRFLTLASLCTIVGVRDALTALVAGAQLRLVDPARVGAREILSVVRDEAITVLFAFPALLRSVVASRGERAGEALRLVRVGGDTTLWSDIDLLRAWLAPGAAIQLIYAATEAPMLQWFVDPAARGGDPRIPIGYPLPGNRLAIVDEDGGAVAPGEVGELVVASAYVSLGLWADGRCVAGERLGTDRVFRTGDLVRQRPDGLLERFGRKDRQVKIRGARVDLDGVEAALRQHPHVRDVGVLARASRGDGAATLVAYVSPRDGAPAGLIENLRTVMRGAPSPMRPAAYHLAREIPRLPGSKLDLGALVALDEANAQADGARPPVEMAAGDPIARAVSRVWQEVLEAPLGDPDDDFFDVGGDSLKAITVMIELERALGLELPLTLINEAPRFADLCAALREQRTAGYTPLVPLKAGEGLAPVFIVHGVGGSVADLFPIARAMAYAGPVFGLQARGLSGHAPPHASVEAMAAAYLTAVRARQPAGPYHLCGYSFGGLVAFEMARRLAQAGEPLGLVGLFDTMTSPVRWPALAWLRILGRRLRGRGGGSSLSGFLRSAPPNVLKVAGHCLLASAKYRPGFYPGELTLFIPSGRDLDLPSPPTIWRRHARAICVVETEGAHATMLAPPHAETIAAAVTRRLVQS